jgi:hypothetical protein
MDSYGRSPKGITQLFMDLSKERTGQPSSRNQAIFSKIKYNDRGFFRYFTTNELTKPKHQKEYEALENEYYENYIKHHKIGYINRTTRKKIRNLINKALIISFIRSGQCNNWKYYQVSNLLDFSFNFFIDPNKEKIPRQEILSLCEEQIYKTLPDLPHDCKDIPSFIKIKLPKSLPISHTKNTGIMAGALRAFYKFDLLPSSFFAKKPDLPDLPTDLSSDFKKIFPIRDPKLMRNIKSIIDDLRESYYVPNKLPDSYFTLPPRKKNLPADFRDLPPFLAIKFPVASEIEEIKTVASLLRDNNYYVSRIPNDWIKNKVPLPPIHWFIENNGTSLPITEQNQVITFIENLQKRHTFTLPLGPEWIDSSLIQITKPNLPNDIDTIAQEFNFNDKLNKDLPNFDRIISNIKNKYNVEDIPEDWIISTIPDLSTIKDANDHLLNINSPIKLPLIEGPSLGDQIKKLRTHFYFNKLPQDFVNEIELPEPGPALLPTSF